MDPALLGELGDSGSRRPVPVVPERRPGPKPTAFGVPTWRKRMARIDDRDSLDQVLTEAATGELLDRQAIQVSFHLSPTDDRVWPISLEIESRRKRVDGEWGPPRRSPLKRREITWIEPVETQTVLDRLAGAADARLGQRGDIPTRFHLDRSMTIEVVPTLATLGVLFQENRRAPLSWDEGGPFETWVSVLPNRDAFRVALVLRRDAEEVLLTGEELVFPSGFVVLGNRLCRVEGPNLQTWQEAFAEPLDVPKKDIDEFLEQFHSFSSSPRLDAPPGLTWVEIATPPVPHLVLCPPGEWPGDMRDELRARIEFDYAGIRILANAPGERARLDSERKVVIRNVAQEASCLAESRRVGVRPRGASALDADSAGMDEDSPLASRSRSRVHASAKRSRSSRLRGGESRDGTARSCARRRSKPVSPRESTGSTWTCGWSTQVPESPRTARNTSTKSSNCRVAAGFAPKERVVRLSSGRLGFLPEEWLERHGWLLEAGELERGAIRFRRSQVALLDALLVAEPSVASDEVFQTARSNLRKFETISPTRAPRGFRATLRPYQELSLGWFEFLRTLGFGGCLADDMGLGKTVMILALLDSRRRAKVGPSLVVVPRSLVFNWKREAEKFAPKLRVHDHTAPDRKELAPYLDLVDVVLTTYGVLRREITQLRETQFDYVILDEAQAIKNANTAAAKSARLLRASHRLAMSGTPIENHLGELWSLFEFLNPGLLGSSPSFQRWVSETPQRIALSSGRNNGEQDRNPATAALVPGADVEGVGERPSRHTLDRADALAHSIQPFILRRSKEQVLAELPPKEEQTLFCSMGERQQKLYDELATHYRNRIIGARAEAEIDPEKTHASQMLVLEALLRLRQAACHPGLVDPRLAGEESAKVDVLLERLGEIAREGHKALVFSQFTSLLAIVKERLQIARIPYEYLDGRTRNREDRVARFQEDPRVPVFLISLKAGGTGLNLTAASYVFLLDPWWNPATESQAIDRAHRMGQERPVLACRLVAHGTVEERILELQERKRGLAEAVIRSDDTGIRNLTREDLEQLLS
ncbi:MAG: DEAD/DEAH box helicase [Candidatus Eisenbacteria bacterium]